MSFLGILSHDEFYLFIIIASTLILFRKPFKVNYSIVFASFLSAMLLVISVDILISPMKYYTQREIFGMPLITTWLFICVCYLGIYLGLYAITISNKHQKNSIFKELNDFTQATSNTCSY